jgi:peptide/nickel transport system permease protein
VLSEPFIRTSRAYGLSERAIVYKYALKLACIPTVAVIGIGVGQILSSALFAEIIFARPGVGTLTYQAILTRNYPVVQGCVLIVVFFFAIVNLLVDMSYAWLDPRVRANLQTSAAGIRA